LGSQLEDLLRPAWKASSEVASRLNRILRRLWEGAAHLNEWVKAFESAKKQNPGFALA